MTRVCSRQGFPVESEAERRTGNAMKSVTFATRLPEDLLASLDELCKLHGLKKSAVVEAAVREHLEVLTYDYELRDAIEDESRFHPWSSVRVELLRKIKPRRTPTKSK